MGNSFDEKAATWDENPRRIKLVEKVWSVLEKQLNFRSIKTVMDYGCGTGLLGYKLINKVERIIFCDTSIPMLEQVEKKRKYYGFMNVETLCADFTKDKLPTQKVDLILSMLVLHHVEAIETLLSKFCEILNSGGLFCWIDLDKENGSFHGGDESIHHFGFDKDEIEKMLRYYGFEVELYNKELMISKEIEGEFVDYPLFVLFARKL